MDLNLGNKSVTNDMENVLRKIEEQEGRSLVDCLIIYRDSEKMYDGVILDGQRVRWIILQRKTKKEAKALFLTKPAVVAMQRRRILLKLKASRGRES